MGLLLAFSDRAPSQAPFLKREGVLLFLSAQDCVQELWVGFFFLMGLLGKGGGFS